MGQRIDRLRPWDGLDAWASGAILILGAVLCYLIAVLDTTAMPGLQTHLPTAAAQTVSPEYAAKMKVADQLLAAGNLEKLNPLLDELTVSHPYQSEPCMRMADYHIRRQEPNWIEPL